jgi:hypothetical protein
MIVVDILKLSAVPHDDNESTAQRGKYGVAEKDSWGLDAYLAEAIANGLRILAKNRRHVFDWDKVEDIISKLTFYYTDVESVMHDYIDWSQDPDADTDDVLSWLNADDAERARNWPGMQEYVAKSEILEQMQRIYLNESLDWLKENWVRLWD